MQSTAKKDLRPTSVIKLGQSFNFESYQNFRALYEAVAPGTHLALDLSGTTYIDSSALGMLLVCRDHLMASQGEVSLRSVRPEVRKILGIARFEQLFKIE